MSDLKLVVTTSLGALEGDSFTTSRGNVIYAFRSVPYGEPPVGDLRFKDPLPAQPWEGIRPVQETSPCAPVLVRGVTITVAENASEDCLYLNVYTPQEPSDDLNLPVMVYLHGGGFTIGNGNQDCIGPDNLVPHGIILVAVNYRLGAFGFLSLQTTDYPGNQGLKDQNLALRWVQNNIAAFGGDPNNVTLFGHSAGSASVQYHLISPMSKGLFHRAIAQSGSVLNRWAYSRNPQKSALLLAKLLGNTSDDVNDALNVLKSASVKDLLLKSTAVFGQIEGVWAGENVLNFPFVPTKEPEGTQNAFLTLTPKEALAKGQFIDVPFISGVTSDEAIFTLPKADYVPSFKDETELQKLLPKEFELPLGSEQMLQAARKLKDFYFSDVVDQKGYIKALTSLLFTYGIWKSLQFYSQNSGKTSPNYLYVLAAGKKMSSLRVALNLTEVEGAAHADDVDFLFCGKTIEKIEPGTRDDRVQKLLTKLWTNFAKTGIPSNDWPSTSSDNNYAYAYLMETLEPSDGFFADEMKFWDDLYSFLEE